MSEWSHLPNARHIDWVLALAEKNPKAWSAARDVARDAANYAAWFASRAAVRDLARDGAWAAASYGARDLARNATWSSARDLARDAVIALVAFDYAGDILDMPAPAVRLLAASGDPAAVLLLPAVIVRSGGTNE